MRATELQQALETDSIYKNNNQFYVIALFKYAGYFDEILRNCVSGDWGIIIIMIKKTPTIVVRSTIFRD